MSKSRSVLGVGLVTALASSLCCIAPLVAIFAGSSSIASSFQWIEPLRPWLIGATVLALGTAWYLQLRPVPKDDCGCEMVNPSFFKGRVFLGIVTVFAAVMLAFPYYTDIFYQSSSSGIAKMDMSGHIEYVKFDVHGMTCSGCEGHVEHAVSELPGIIKVEASFENEQAIIQYDAAQTDIESIREAIQSTSYDIGESIPIESLKFQ